MKVTSGKVRVEGHLLNRMYFAPDGGAASKAAIFYHGQGDYAERYEEVLHVFTGNGVRCMVTELPGHGLSPGRRGHCGDQALLDAVVRDSLENMEGMPYGVMGHSMGGLLALRHLVLSGQGEYPVPEFAWLSSPLLYPSKRRTGRQLAMIRMLSSIMPGLTISTGVTPQMCRVKREEGADTLESPPKHQLWHKRVSLGWGAALLAIEKTVHQGVTDIPVDMDLIFTQGAEDPICPVELARGFFPLLPVANKSYLEFDGMLHEPFRGEGSERLFEAIAGWLTRS